MPANAVDGGKSLLTFALALALGSFLASCGSSEDASLAPCREPFEAGRFEEAARRCSAIFRVSRSPEAGLLAAKAQKELGQLEAFFDWHARLTETSAEADYLGLVVEAHREAGDREKLLDAYQQLAKVYVDAGDFVEASATYYRMFYLAWGQSEHRVALNHAREALAHAIEADDRESQGNALVALATVYYETGDLESALAALREAGTYIPRQRQDRHARLLLNEGAFRIDQQEMHLAGDALKRALELGGSEGEPALFRSIHLNLVQANLALDRIEEAERHMKAAREHAGDNRYPSLLYFQAEIELARGDLDEAAATNESALAVETIPAWTQLLEYQRGCIEESRGNLSGAEDAYAASAAVVDSLRDSLGLDDLKSWMLDERREPYEALFRLQASAGRAQDALMTLERAKSRAFLDAFVQTLQASHDADAVEAARNRLDAFEALVPSLSESGVAELRPIEEVLEALGERHVLAYFVAGSELWMVEVSNASTRAHLLSDESEDVARLARDFVANVDDRELAAELGGLLLPETAMPASGSTLHIISDGALSDVSFAALGRGGRYVVDDFVITYVPGLQGVAASRDMHELDYGDAVVVADPRSNLPAARREALEVGSSLGVAPHVGTAAAFTVLNAAARADILHVAAHTGVDHRGPWIELADGRVRADALLERRIGPRLVVLASCSSAAREGMGSWGSLGLAFLAAGSREVVASLWSVDDATARSFVHLFYEKGGALESAEAVARAQRALVEAGRPPSDWASFVHLGVGETHSGGT